MGCVNAQDMSFGGCASFRGVQAHNLEPFWWAPNSGRDQFASAEMLAIECLCVCSYVHACTHMHVCSVQTESLKAAAGNQLLDLVPSPIP